MLDGRVTVDALLLQRPSARGAVAVTVAAAQPAWVYVFGPFKLDPSRGRLTYGTEVVPLPYRLFELLMTLVRANGCIVSREALYAQIWPEGGVADSSLSQHIYMLRRALGERAGDRLYIATIHDRGFRFVAPISIEDATQNFYPVIDQCQPNEEDVTPSLTVIHDYSRAFRSLERGTANCLSTAVQYFESALRNDPNYVPCLVGLARAHLLLAQHGYSSGHNEFPKAKDVIIKALQLDPTCAAAHAVNSNIMLFCDWNWRDAKRELDAAVQLDPKHATVRASAIWVFAWIGQHEKALAEVEHAVVAEPSSPHLQLLLGRALIDRGDYQGAIDHLSDLIETYPDHAATARRYRAEALISSGQPANAVLDLSLLPQDRAEDLAFRLPLLALAHAKNGDAEKAHDVYDVLVAMEKTDYIPAGNLVPIALAVGRRGQALEHFEKALNRREPGLPLLRFSPWLTNIRLSDPFKSLLNEMDAG
jgi:DNA-binding winged helix-turn-helix (wHTH) protein/Flp pilus assembly protein TadD